MVESNPVIIESLKPINYQETFDKFGFEGLQYYLDFQERK